MHHFIENVIAPKLNVPANLLTCKTVGGGSINETFFIKTPGTNFFCKINNASNFPQMLYKEGNALEYISGLNIIKTPGVIGYVESESNQALILEWITQGLETDTFWKNFGEQLAALHKITNEEFGWKEDNYMGSIVQQNNWTKDWTSFFISNRLEPLVTKCSRKGLLDNKHISKFETVYKEVANIFAPEPPALIHGDLWSGNYMCNEHEEPVLIDPAINFGNRAADLGMTTLFGGFNKLFYEAYHYHFPLPVNYQQQWRVCNLYPLLIHLLLFGSGYRTRIEHILEEFN